MKGCALQILPDESELFLLKRYLDYCGFDPISILLGWDIKIQL